MRNSYSLNLKFGHFMQIASGFFKTKREGTEMKVTMEFNELNNLLSRYVQVGFMEAVRMYEPAQDMIRLTEVKAWLKMVRVDYNTFKTLVDKGTIRARKAGDAKNSPLYYSKKEIQQALASLGVMRAINKE